MNPSCAFLRNGPATFRAVRATTFNHLNNFAGDERQGQRRPVLSSFVWRNGLVMLSRRAISLLVVLCSVGWSDFAAFVARRLIKVIIVCVPLQFPSFERNSLAAFAARRLVVIRHLRFAGEKH